MQWQKLLYSQTIKNNHKYDLVHILFTHKFESLISMHWQNFYIVKQSRIIINMTFKVVIKKVNKLIFHSNL